MDAEEVSLGALAAELDMEGRNWGAVGVGAGDGRSFLREESGFVVGVVAPM